MMMMMLSTLYLTNTLSWIFIVLIHWSNSPSVDMSLHWVIKKADLCPYSLMRRTLRRSSKQHCLTFELATYRTQSEDARHYTTQCYWFTLPFEFPFNSYNFKQLHVGGDILCEHILKLFYFHTPCLRFISVRVINFKRSLHDVYIYKLF